MARPAALITGVSGFLGRALVARLSEQGVSIVGLARHAPRDALPSGVSFRAANVMDPAVMVAAVAEVVAFLGPVTAVYHLAGLAHADECRKDPSRAWALNATATLHLLEACRAAGLRRIIFPSTALVYGTPTRVPVVEDAMLAPASAYAATKAAAEALLAGYAADFGFSCDIARLGNVYGPGAAKDSVVASLLAQAASGSRLSVRSSAPVRDFVFLQDVAEGLIRLALAGEETGCRVFNLSSGEPTSIGELADTVRRVAGMTGEVEQRRPEDLGEASRLVLSIQRLEERTAWRPRRPLAEGIHETLAAMRKGTS